MVENEILFPVEEYRYMDVKLPDKEISSIISNIRGTNQYYMDRLPVVCRLLGLEKALDFYRLYSDIQYPRGYHGIIHVAILINHFMSLYVVYHTKTTKEHSHEMLLSLIFHDFYWHIGKSDNENTKASMDFFDVFCDLFGADQKTRETVRFFVENLEYPYHDVDKEHPLFLPLTKLRLLDNMICSCSNAMELYALLVFRLYQKELGLTEHTPEVYEVCFRNYSKRILEYANSCKEIIGDHILINMLHGFNVDEFVSLYFKDKNRFKLFSVLAQYG